MKSRQSSAAQYSRGFGLRLSDVTKRNRMRWWAFTAPHLRMRCLAEQRLPVTSHIRRCRLVGEPALAATLNVTDTPRSPASRFLQWISAELKISIEPQGCRSALARELRCVRRVRCWVCRRLRGQARSYSGSRQAPKSAKKTPPLRRRCLSQL